eukprot:m.130110 g.130110  ORF g.130110 m.130110 type:complete len:840 (-) comp13056_c0_seq1:269-2788(-)
MSMFDTQRTFSSATSSRRSRRRSSNGNGSSITALPPLAVALSQTVEKKKKKPGWKSVTHNDHIPHMNFSTTGCGCPSCRLLEKKSKKLVVRQKTMNKLPRLPFKVGDRVVLLGEKCGVIRWVGRLDSKYDNPLIHVGVQLDDPDGFHDGVLGGKRYFKCPHPHGVFVAKESILLAKGRKDLKYKVITPPDEAKSSAEDPLLGEQEEKILKSIRPPSEHTRTLLKHNERLLTAEKKKSTRTPNYNKKPVTIRKLKGPKKNKSKGSKGHGRSPTKTRRSDNSLSSSTGSYHSNEDNGNYNAVQMRQHDHLDKKHTRRRSRYDDMEKPFYSSATDDFDLGVQTPDKHGKTPFDHDTDELVAKVDQFKIHHAQLKVLQQADEAQRLLDSLHKKNRRGMPDSIEHEALQRRQNRLQREEEMERRKLEEREQRRHEQLQQEQQKQQKREEQEQARRRREEEEEEEKRRKKEEQEERKRIEEARRKREEEQELKERKQRERELAAKQHQEQPYGSDSDSDEEEVVVRRGADTKEGGDTDTRESTVRFAETADVIIDSNNSSITTSNTQHSFVASHPEHADDGIAELNDYVHQLFESADINQNNVLDAFEFGSLLHSEVMGLNMQPGQETELMELTDENNDGRIDANEFANVFVPLMHYMYDESMEEEHANSWVEVFVSNRGALLLHRESLSITVELTRTEDDDIDEYHKFIYSMPTNDFDRTALLTFLTATAQNENPLELTKEEFVRVLQDEEFGFQLTDEETAYYVELSEVEESGGAVGYPHFLMALRVLFTQFYFHEVDEAEEFVFMDSPTFGHVYFNRHSGEPVDTQPQQFSIVSADVFGGEA